MAFSRDSPSLGSRLLPGVTHSLHVILFEHHCVWDTNGKVCKHCKDSVGLDASEREVVGDFMDLGGTVAAGGVQGMSEWMRPRYHGGSEEAMKKTLAYTRVAPSYKLAPRFSPCLLTARKRFWLAVPPTTYAASINFQLRTEVSRSRKAVRN